MYIDRSYKVFIRPNYNGLYSKVYYYTLRLKRVVTDEKVGLKVFH